MNTDDPDIVEMDFPPYVEEYSPFPDVEADFNFEDNKEEIYRRNRIIAAEKQLAVLREENRQKLEKQEQYREISEKSEPVKPQRRIPIALLSSAMIVICFIFVIAVKTAVHDYDHDYDYVTTVQPTEVLQVSETKPVTRAKKKTVPPEAAAAETEEVVSETQVEAELTDVRETIEVYETEAETNSEILKITAVREPLAEDGSSFIYNTAAMSYKLTPSYRETQDGGTFLNIFVTVKNLTNYNYSIVPNFIIDNDGDLTRASVNDSSSNMNCFHVEQLVNGEWTKTDSEAIAYDFDENHLCSFRLQFYYSEAYGVFSFAPNSRISREYAEKSDEGFEVPLEDILKYIS